MSHRVTVVITSVVAAWILWAQPHRLMELNDKIMVDGREAGDWRYVDGFDTKQTCHERRKLLIGEQEAMLAGLAAGADLDKIDYKAYRCYPESMHPLRLTRGVDD